MIWDPRPKIDLLEVLKVLISGELSIQSFYRIIERSCEEKDAREGRIKRLVRDGKYSIVEVDFINNVRIVDTKKYKVEDPNRELYEGMVLWAIGMKLL